MYGWLIRIGTNLAPFAYGWIANDIPDYLSSLNPFDSGNDDEKAAAGWGLSTLLLIAIAGYFGWQKWKK